MNVLLTSVGRRAYLVKYFKQVLNGQGEVHVSNSDANTVAFQYADKSVVSPLIYDNEYIPFLLQYCKDNHIKILISLFDIDLLVLSQNKKAFANIGTQVIVSEPEVIKICNDKWNTYNFLSKNGFATPKTYISLKSTMEAIKNGEVAYPIIVKPRFGCGSIAVSIAEDEEELRYCYARNTDRIEKTYLKYESNAVAEKIVFQEYLTGDEFGADIINDLNGRFQNVIIRRKIAMRAGETDIAEIVDNTHLKSIFENLSQKLGHIANMDCDIMYHHDVPYILELNARFGGGYPFSHMAGCNLPQAIVNWVTGTHVDSKILEAQIGYRGYKELVVTGGVI